MILSITAVGTAPILLAAGEHKGEAFISSCPLWQTCLNKFTCLELAVKVPFGQIRRMHAKVSALETTLSKKFHFEKESRGFIHNMTSAQDIGLKYKLIGWLKTYMVSQLSFGECFHASDAKRGRGRRCMGFY